MAKNKAPKAGATAKSNKTASGKKRPPSPTRPKGPRGNHAVIINGPPPTPPRRKKNGKRKQFDPEDEDEDEPDPEDEDEPEPEPPKKKPKKIPAASERPKPKGAKQADPDSSASDRQAAGPSSSGKHGRKKADDRSAPRSSSPSSSGTTTSSRAPQSSSNSSAPTSNNTTSSDRATSSRAAAHTTPVSGSAPPQHPSKKPPPSSHRAISPKTVAPNTLNNAASVFKGLADMGHDDLNLDNPVSKKTSNYASKLIRDEEMEFEEDEEDEGLNLGGGEPEDQHVEADAENSETEDDDEDDEDEDDEDEDDEDVIAEEVDDGNINDDDAAEELTEREAVDFLQLIRSLKDEQYGLDKLDGNPKTVAGHFKTWARHAHRLCGIYTDIDSVIVTGMTVVKADPKTAADYEDCYRQMPNMTAKSAKFYTKKFFHLCDHVPKFKLLCQYLLTRSRGMFHFAKFFEIHASAGRSSDIATLKRSFHSYLPTVFLPNGDIIPPLTVNQYVNLKSRNAGYYSDCSARLIIPINERDVFDEELHEYAKRKNVQRKEQEREAARPKKLHKNDRPKPADGSVDDDKTFPGFLFPTIQVFDKESPHRGIFKGELCFTATRHLFRGPSSIGRPDGLPGFGRSCLAGVYKIKHFTPDLLAYVATLVRHLISVDARWQKETADCGGHHFHTALHTMLSVDYEAWKEDRDRADVEMDDDDDDIDVADENIFSYYNRCIFGSKWGDPVTQVVKSFDLDDTDDEDNLRARMLAARKAELAVRHHPRPRKGKQRASSKDLRTSEQHEQIAQDSSIEFIEAAPASNPSEGSAGDSVGTGTSGADDNINV